MTSGSCHRWFLLFAVLLCTVVSLLLLIYFEKYRDKAKRKCEERAGGNTAVHLYTELILQFVLLSLQSKTKTKQALKSYFPVSLCIILYLVAILEANHFDPGVYS